MLFAYAGIFSLIASLIIFVMGVTMLKMDRAKAKWRIKLQRAFSGQGASSVTIAVRRRLTIHLQRLTAMRGPASGCS